jgi:hypothetical protein
MEARSSPLGISKAKTLDPPTGHGLAGATHALLIPCLTLRRDPASFIVHQMILKMKNRKPPKTVSPALDTPSS